MGVRRFGDIFGQAGSHAIPAEPERQQTADSGMDRAITDQREPVVFLQLHLTDQHCFAADGPLLGRKRQDMAGAAQKGAGAVKLDQRGFSLLVDPQDLQR